MSIGLRPPASVLPEAGRPTAARSLWSDAWLRLRRNRVAVAAAAFLVGMSALTALAPWLPGLPDPALQDLARGASPPSLAHVLGTDELGRDLLARVVFGSRTSLIVGFASIAFGIAVGGAIGPE